MPHTTSNDQAAHPLHAAVDEWAHCADQITDGNLWTGFNCGEIETLAAVFRTAGHDDTAAFIVRMHREDDDEGDNENH
ncbi:hypothetical protein FO059_17965 (plasmid) [Tomitella fengzijianii]|uniref:Uncharacterized protein n=1 Tax=Tomitella fengzijianii TaxID=2597660 RepID=A0A516X8S8_9ACTN|nr:hypothetical protein [Tomitella fengzijianii]QDQ99486.1 hypothetical protein FO059_17965 [Tomitella fengzijianii]